MQFLPKSFHLTNVPVVRLCNETLNFSKKVKYLGVYLTNALTDDDDINRQVRSLYCSANQLKSAFSHCWFDVKNLLFKSYCTNFYGSHLWSNYLKSSFHSIRVACNDCYRMLHNLPRYTSAREFQVINHIPTFEALSRKTLYNFINRCLNLLVTNMMNAYCFFDSQFFTYYRHMLCSFLIMVVFLTCTFVLSIILYGQYCLKLVFKFLNLNHSVEFLLFCFVFLLVCFFSLLWTGSLN